jgi:demethylmenaquinone methyltransferase / 2-methoxy-6-polyprenyl-1,4-benzoquinol methylase
VPGTAETAERFDHVAPRYDLCNRLLSGGQDHRWRERLVAALGPRAKGRVLDLGCGTGDVALRLARGGGAVVGADPSRGMLLRARAKAPTLDWVQADALHLPFKGEAFDGSTTAFVLRNLPSRRAAFAEQARVLRPGGVAAHLELVRPAKGWARAVHGAYVRWVVPALGLLSSDPASYRYLSRTVLEVPPPEAFAAELGEVGLGQPRVERMALGGVAVVAGTKAPGGAGRGNPQRS